MGAIAFLLGVLFVDVLLGLDPDNVEGADMNGDGCANGEDIQPFVDALLE